MARVVQLRVGALPCPLPIVRLAECARGLDAGDVVDLTGSDPAIGPDVDAWCMRLATACCLRTGAQVGGPSGSSSPLAGGIGFPGPRGAGVQDRGMTAGAAWHRA